MRIDALASEVQYARHLRPVWDALPDEVRGTFWLGPRIARDRSECPPYGVLRRPGNPVLVASYTDDLSCPGRTVIDMNHGAGQSYGADPAAARHPSYAGGDHRERVRMFLVPGPHPARRDRERWPGVPVIEVGCPVLDDAQAQGWTRDPGRRPAAPVVAVCFHWENALCPETRSAWREFSCGLAALAADFALIGHAHPRAESAARPMFERLGIPWAPYDEVMVRADAVVVDNSSIGFEAAACGKALVWMTPSTYRHLPHGLRFGPERGLGVECRAPAGLVDAVDEALGHRPLGELLGGVYACTSGAAQRAAGAICEFAMREGAAGA